MASMFSPLRLVQSVHVSRSQVIHSFGREDQLHREALARLVRSITRCGDRHARSLDQNPDRQLDGVPLDRTFTDSASGRSTARPQLEAMLAFVRDGDSDRPNRSSATTTTVSPAQREDVNPVAARGEVAFGDERCHRRIERIAAGGQPGDLRRGLAPHPASLAVNTWQLNSPPRPEVSAAVGARIAELAVKYSFT